MARLVMLQAVQRAVDCAADGFQRHETHDVQQAAADEAKKLVDAAALAAERLVDATKEAEADKASRG
jgi:hypothetical protein